VGGVRDKSVDLDGKSREEEGLVGREVRRSRGEKGKAEVFRLGTERAEEA
jgi:hypothetical protein